MALHGLHLVLRWHPRRNLTPAQLSYGVSAFLSTSASYAPVARSCFAILTCPCGTRWRHKQTSTSFLSFDLRRLRSRESDSGPSFYLFSGSSSCSPTPRACSPLSAHGDGQRRRYAARQAFRFVEVLVGWTPTGTGLVLSRATYLDWVFQGFFPPVPPGKCGEFPRRSRSLDL